MKCELQITHRRVTELWLHTQRGQEALGGPGPPLYSQTPEDQNPESANPESQKRPSSFLHPHFPECKLLVIMASPCRNPRRTKCHDTVSHRLSIGPQQVSDGTLLFGAWPSMICIHIILPSK